MTIQRQTNPSGGQHGYTRESALLWAAAHLQEELAAMPDHARAERVALARQRAAEKPGSYLAMYFRVLYGEK